MQTTISPAQAKLIEQGLANHKRAQALLHEWERLSEAEIFQPGEQNSD